MKKNHLLWAYIAMALVGFACTKMNEDAGGTYHMKSVRAIAFISGTVLYDSTWTNLGNMTLSIAKSNNEYSVMGSANPFPTMEVKSNNLLPMKWQSAFFNGTGLMQGATLTLRNGGLSWTNGVFPIILHRNSAGSLSLTIDYQDGNNWSGNRVIRYLIELEK